ncbi:MAG TPA: patatin family protein [Candidatus Aphodovivens avistercoris]|nr:patatin family protein [Candidatus Aphodovivens avistercoris]
MEHATPEEAEAARRASQAAAGDRQEPKAAPGADGAAASEAARQAAADAPQGSPLDGSAPAWQGAQLTEADLILEGGAMRGQFTAGVLDVLMDRRLFCRRVIGVSAGALCGYNYVAGAVGRSCFLNVKYCDDWRYLSLKSFARTGNAYGREFAFDRIPNELEPFDAAAFDRSPLKLVAVSSNLETGEADYHELSSTREGMPYVIASSSMPLVSQIMEIDGKKLLDGGTCDSVPCLFSLLTAPATRKRIVVLTQDATYRKGPNKLMPLLHQRYADFPYYLERLQSRHFLYNRTYRALARAHKRGAAFVIRPQRPVEVSSMERDPAKLMDLYEQGCREAVRQWDALQCYLEA